LVIGNDAGTEQRQIEKGLSALFLFDKLCSNG